MTEPTELVAKQALRPVNLIPVGLKEAAWDSPSFRASVLHASDQVDNIEKWLDNCVRATSRLATEALALEALLNSFVLNTTPPLNISEAVVDHDYSLVAVKKFADAAKDSWIANVTELKKLDTNIVDPLKRFSQKDFRSFKDCRRILEQSQKVFDQLQSKYSAQAKTKEPSSLREDAFQLHEARKVYLKASLDFATMLPQLKFALDKLLTRVFANQTQAMRATRDNTSLIFGKYAAEVGRIRSWSKELESGEQAFRKELQSARAQIEEASELASRPSRELEDYAIASSSIKGPTSNLQSKSNVSSNGKQGWLHMKVVTGKPTRTIWLRRWFFVKNGVFGWLVQGTRSGGIEESERIGVLLCGLRPATSEERRFCFEVKTKDITIVLQADSQSDLANWMVAFDIAKKKAIEDPGSTKTITSPSQPMDLAFAISSPSTIEFTASAMDVGLTSEDAHDRVVSGSLNVPNDLTSPTYRGSFDVTAVRRTSGMDSDTGIHSGRSTRKVSASPQIGTLGGAPNPSAGIAGLISASNMTLPLAATTALQPLSAEFNKPFSTTVLRTPLGTTIRSLPRSSLAPSTLATPPVPTNLSNATVILNGENGNTSAQMDLVKGTPSGMMANSWGSLNWAYNNLLERQDLSTAKVFDPESALAVTRSPDKTSGTIPAISRGHRKTVSLDGEKADLQRTIIKPGTFPNYYPALLKHHDAQFRILFPNAKRHEKIVLVFRATWDPSNQGDFPGRIYVTPYNIYFYSNHLGLILTSSLPLHRITEITAALGRECDYLFVHLKESQTVDYTRITVKVFLEPLKLLQKRLNYLVQNMSGDPPDDLDAIMKTMLTFEQPETSGEKSPSVGSADGYDPDNILSYGGQINGKDLRTRLRIDQDLVGNRNFDEMEKFKLPSRPVVYVPNGMKTPVVEMNFKISPKALFHVLFGDRSAIWQLLYHQRGARSIRQGPWTKPEQGFFRRAFDYQVPQGLATGLSQDIEVIDTQTVDVFSDHLCYVVTERKSAWHLPLGQQLELISKIVITHVAKSNCKLAIYTAVQWTKTSILKPLIDHQALAGLKLDALDLMDVVSEQVSRLGYQGQAKKAVQIFGQIGQDTQVMEFQGTDGTTVPRVRHMSQRKSITRLFFGAYGSFIASCVNVVLAQIIAIFDWVMKSFNANLWLVLLSALSLLVNAVFSSGLAFSWWQDHRASQYMQSFGITKDMTMTRAITLTDLDLIIAPQVPPNNNNSNNICYQTFKKATSPTQTPSRLPKSQRLLDTYRHDLTVALRVLNSIQQEITQSEWEYWLEDETRKCRTARDLLGSKRGSGSSSNSRGKAGIVGGGVGGNGSQADTAERLIMYCGSCEQEMRAVREMR